MLPDFVAFDDITHEVKVYTDDNSKAGLYEFALK